MIRLFSYGSNMLHARIMARINFYSRIGTGSLGGHTLKFHKRGEDGSAKADAYFVGGTEDRMWGVVAEIDETSRFKLDRIEGLGSGYNAKMVVVEMGDGSRIDAMIYVADWKFIDRSLKPFDWYKAFVLHGSIENGLPESYVKKIVCVPAMFDGNIERRRKNYRLLENAEKSRK